jgi:regulator of protease activity HflC (stomatin/prohibitin superfamily)
MILGGSALAEFALAELPPTAAPTTRRKAGWLPEFGRHKRRYITREELERRLAQQRSFTPEFFRGMHEAWDAQEEAERAAEAAKTQKQKAALASAARLAAEALNEAEAARAEDQKAAAQVEAIKRNALAAANAKTTADILKRSSELAKSAKALQDYMLLLDDDDEAVSLLLF